MKMHLPFKNVFVFSILVLFASCSTDKKSGHESATIFKALPSDYTGIDFRNDIKEDHTFNILTYDGLLQGAGVGILDYNNDGLQDLFFANNQGQDKLYKNLGGLQFEDVSQDAGIKNIDEWTSGVFIVDINNDGYDDIYLTCGLREEPQKRANRCYINQKNGKFQESAKELGIDDKGYSIAANFFDIDQDGDLDLYVGNQPPNKAGARQHTSKQLDYSNTDNLFRNDGGKFTNITEEANIKNYAFALSTLSFDYNNDGYIDIYVANDFEEPDYLYHNNGNGTFTNVANTAVKHMSNFSMGSDLADIDNDGFEDFFIADMVAKDNYRLKTNMSGMNPERFFMLANNGYHYQYMFNCLQKNNGNGTFSDVANLAGVSQTDWSWSPLFIDFDLDGYKDLYVTNGLFKDVNNNDYTIKANQYVADKRVKLGLPEGANVPVEYDELTTFMPSKRIDNYAFKNKDGLQFENQIKDLGLSFEGWTNGAAYADLDNDGDLEIVVNNINDEAILYENFSADKKLGNYINIEVEADNHHLENNAKVIITLSNGHKRVASVTPYRAFLSSSQAICQFGLGDNVKVQKVEVEWIDGMVTELINPKINQTHTIKKVAGSRSFTPLAKVVPSSEVEGIKHVESNFDDYAKEILLPSKMSTLGPITAQADVNGDGVTDFYLGGAKGIAGQLFISKEHGFVLTPQNSIENDKQYEDGGALFFDYDKDGDLDLFITSGSNESTKNSDYQDRLYRNDNQNFVKTNLIPNANISSGAVVNFDINGDGYEDLFVAGRQIPGKYGEPADSYVLISNAGKSFNIANGQVADQLHNLGMVTVVNQADIDGDGSQNIIVTGEWMDLVVFDVKGGELIDISEKLGFGNNKGWWYCAKTLDIDNDGDLDIVAGNLGLNIKYKASAERPFKLFADDFDKNGTHDVYLGYYDDDGVCYPVRGRQCSSQQMPFVKEKFKSYHEFASASIDDVLKEKLTDKTVRLSASTFEHSIFINNNGTFDRVAMPAQTQVSPIYDIAIADLNGDKYMDVVTVGNYYDREVETTRSDAGIGNVLMNEQGALIDIPAFKSGFYADKDARAVLINNRSGKFDALVFNNNDLAQIFVIDPSTIK